MIFLQRIASVYTSLVKLLRDLNLWEEVVEKAVDTKIKASLKSYFEIKEIDYKYLKAYRLSNNKEKDKVN